MRTIKILLISLGGLVALPFVVVGLVLAVSWTSLPKTEGTVRVAGISAPVEIRRDDIGIPRITGASHADVAYGLGYAHAQDRLMQMELIRRLGRGELSAIIGSMALNTDKMMRTLGVGQLAEASYRGLGPEMKAVLDSYTAGVNAWRATRSGVLPLEFTLLAHDFEPWEPADSLIIQRLLALMLSGDWRDEIRRVQLADVLGPEEAAFFLNEEGPIEPIPVQGGPLPQETAALLRGVLTDWPSLIKPRRASNAWVVDGTRSISGRPVLATDPHLGVTAPNIWYAARLEIPDLSITGGTIPGAPTIMIGHNGHVAWGLTTTYADTADLVIERLAGENGSRYLTEDGPADFKRREEIIEVRFSEPELLVVRSTRHGPLVSDAIESARAVAKAGTAIALKATALDPEDRSSDALLALNTARTHADAMAALKAFGSPQQNFVYAMKSGEIGVVTAGTMPKRTDRHAGRLPAEGWESNVLWQGEVAFANLAQNHNPDTGVVLNANNRIAPPDDPWFGSGNYAAPYRAERIAERLNHRKLWSAPTMAMLQNDTVNPAARRIVPLLLSHLDEDRLQSEAAQHMAAWPHRMDRELVGPLIYTHWMKALWPKLVADELGPAAEEYKKPSRSVLLGILDGRPIWCDVKGTPDIEDCAIHVIAAFDEAIETLTARYGPKVRKWHWGKAHRTDFVTLPFGAIPVVGQLFTYSLPTDGGADTIRRAAMRYTGRMPFKNIHTAGFSMTVDMGMPDQAQFMVALGQSANIYSRHYADLAEAWANGERFTIPSDPGLEAAILVLSPR